MIDLFVETFLDYAKYLFFLDQDNVFNKALFLEQKSNSEKKFLNEIIDTQFFQQFSQNVINEVIGYFNNNLALKEMGRKNTDKKNSKKEKIQKEYMMCPEFLKLRTNTEHKLLSLIKELNINIQWIKIMILF